ncbi:MAG: hypothetical protein Q7T11_05740 [Deltaproteobacteria bacterium]|nr:hypothetical protein [Deltaproteobacteria bacterium]
MKAVGIKNLKNNLSRYLQEVRKGELVYVTDHDEIIAELHKPVTPVTGKFSRWEAFLNEEERKGAIRLATCKDFDAFEHLKKIPPLPKKFQEQLQKIYEDVRSDRFE